MANKTISDLRELSTVSDNNVLVVETNNETFKVTKENLLKEVNTQLNTKSNVKHTHDEYVTESELNNKGYLTEHIDISGKANISDLANVATSGDYNDLTNKPTIPTVDVNKSYVDTKLSNKADKSEIPSLNGYATEAFVTNKIAEASLSGGEVDLNGLATKDELATKADKTHNHDTVYALKTDIPTVPTKTSQLTNDSGFITSVPSEYITETELSAKSYATETYVQNKIAEASLSGGEDGHLASSRLKGHSWSVLGDSISHDNMYTTSQYWDYVSQRVGGMNIYNYGISGQRITHFVNRYSQMNYSDVITVFGGVNDWGQSNPTPLGTIDDTDASTFYGALKVLCEGLLTTFSKSLIIFLTPLGNNGFSGFASDKNSLGLTVYDYSKAILEVCAKYKIRVIDICANSMLNPYVSNLKSLYFVDGLHLNQLGHEVLSYLIESEIEKCYIPTIVGESVIPVTSISLNTNSHDMQIGDTFMLTPTVLPNNATNKNVVWSVNNSNCAINNGLVTAKSVGQSVITATTVDGNYTAKCTVTVLESNDESDEGTTVPEIVGKTFTGTGFEYDELYHLRIVLDRNNITGGDSVETRILFSNPTNFKITTHVAANHFGTNDINNKDVNNPVTVTAPAFVQSLDDSSGMLLNSSTGTFSNGVNNFKYINICVMMMASAVPFGGTVEELKVLVNGVEQEILLIDTFFNRETYTIS